MLAKLFRSGRKKGISHEIGELVTDYSFLKADTHSHLIPGIDDGAKTIDDSINMVERLMLMGYECAITTPHIKWDHYPNTRSTIQAGLEILQQALIERNINFPVKAAAEYYLDSHFMQLLDTEPLLTVCDDQILVEMSFLFEPDKLTDIIFQIQDAGYKPILAHPERYAFYHSRPEVYKDLKNRGCLLQLNTISLTGYYGQKVKAVAEKLLANNLYDYCGTDMHHLKHAETLESILQTPKASVLKNYPFLNSELAF